MSVADVITAGKRQGLKIKPQDVHAARSAEKKRRTTGPKGKPAARRPKLVLKDDDHERAFRRAVVAIGLVRARALLDAILSEVDA